MTSLLLHDTFILICNEMYIKNIFKATLIAHTHKNIIKNHNFINKQIPIKNENMLQYIINNYNIKKLQLKFALYNWAKYMYVLMDCHTLCIEHVNIPDIHIAKFKKCHTLNISGNNVTDKSLKKLKYCHTIKLNFTLVTDKCIKYLKNCHKVELFDTNVTDIGIKKLKKCHTVNIGYTNVTENGIKKLKNCHTIKIAYIKKTNIDVKKLRKYYNIKFMDNKIEMACLLRISNYAMFNMHGMRIQ